MDRTAQLSKAKFTSHELPATPLGSTENRSQGHAGSFNLGLTIANEILADHGLALPQGNNKFERRYLYRVELRQEFRRPRAPWFDDGDPCSRSRLE